MQSSYCTILINSLTKSDILAACIQADAAVSAGAAQAAATTDAGFLTLGAGAFAIIGGWLTYKAAREQIAAARHEQALQRRHDIKSQCFIAAVKAIAVGIGVVVRMANLELRGQDVLIDYNARADDLLAVHLVTELETGALLLNCIKSIGDMHRTLIEMRPYHPDGIYSLEVVINWSRQCTRLLNTVLPSVTKTVGAMREELGLRVDIKLYEDIIKSAYDQTIAANEQLFNRIVPIK